MEAPHFKRLAAEAKAKAKAGAGQFKAGEAGGGASALVFDPAERVPAVGPPLMPVSARAPLRERKWARPNPTIRLPSSLTLFPRVRCCSCVFCGCFVGLPKVPQVGLSALPIGRDRGSVRPIKNEGRSLRQLYGHGTLSPPPPPSPPGSPPTHGLERIDLEASTCSMV